MARNLIVKKEFLNLRIGDTIVINDEGNPQCGVNNLLGLHIEFNWKEALNKNLVEWEKIKDFLFPLNSWVRVKENPISWASLKDNSAGCPIDFSGSKHKKDRREYPVLGFVTQIDSTQNICGYNFTPFGLRISNEDFAFSYSPQNEGVFEAVPTIKDVSELKIGDWLASPLFQTKSDKDYIVYQVFDIIGNSFGLRCLDSEIILGQSGLPKYNFIKVTPQEAENLLLLKDIKKNDWVEIIPIKHIAWESDYKRFANQKFQVDFNFNSDGQTHAMKKVGEYSHTNFDRLSLRLLSKKEVEAIQSSAPIKTKKQELIEKLIQEADFKVGNRFVSLGITYVLIDNIDESRFEYREEKKSLYYITEDGARVGVINEWGMIRKTYPNIQVGKYYAQFYEDHFNFGCKNFTLQKAEMLLELMGKTNFDITFREAPDAKLTYSDVYNIVSKYKAWLGNK